MVRWAPSTFPTALSGFHPEGQPGFGEEGGIRRSPSPNLHLQLYQAPHSKSYGVGVG